MSELNSNELCSALVLPRGVKLDASLVHEYMIDEWQSNLYLSQLTIELGSLLDSLDMLLIYFKLFGFFFDLLSVSLQLNLDQKLLQPKLGFD